MTIHITLDDEDRCDGRDTCSLCGRVLDEGIGSDIFNPGEHDLRVCPDPDCGWVCVENEARSVI